MYHLLCLPHVPTANQPTLMVTTLFQKSLDTPALNVYLIGYWLESRSVYYWPDIMFAWCFSPIPDMSWHYCWDPFTSEYHLCVPLWRLNIFGIKGAVRRHNIFYMFYIKILRCKIYWLKVKVIIKILVLTITPAIRRDTTVATVAKLEAWWQAEPPSDFQVGERLFCMPYRPDRLLGPSNLLFNWKLCYFLGDKVAGAWNLPLTFMKCWGGSTYPVVHMPFGRESGRHYR